MPANFSQVRISLTPSRRAASEFAPDGLLRATQHGGRETQSVCQSALSKTPWRWAEEQIDDDRHAGRNADEEPDIKQRARGNLTDLDRAEQVERVNRDQRDNRRNRAKLAGRGQKHQAEGDDRHRRNAPHRLVDDGDGHQQHKEQRDRHHGKQHQAQ